MSLLIFMSCCLYSEGKESCKKYLASKSSQKVGEGNTVDFSMCMPQIVNSIKNTYVTDDFPPTYFA